jgi:hypothetical protein
MSTSQGRNEGIRVIATFDDRAIPLSPGQDEPARATRSANEGVRMIATFEDPAGAPAAPTQVAALISRIESALQTIHAALVEIKQIQSKAG